eukprot:1158357-Pelagomonas_calceolata.AAC.7
MPPLRASTLRDAGTNSVAPLAACWGCLLPCCHCWRCSQGHVQHPHTRPQQPLAAPVAGLGGEAEPLACYGGGGGGAAAAAAAHYAQQARAAAAQAPVSDAGESTD